MSRVPRGSQIGMLGMAIALLAGNNPTGNPMLDDATRGYNAGLSIRHSLDNHYRTVSYRSGRASGAAAQKRAARKRQNIRARASKRHG